MKLCIQHVESLTTEITTIEHLKFTSILQSILSDIKFKFWPDILSNEKLQNLQEKIDDLQNQFKKLTEHAQLKLNELQSVQNYATKYTQLKTQFEQYLEKTEANILNLGPIGISENYVTNQKEGDQKLITEYEQKSTCLNELKNFTGTYLSLIFRISGGPVIHNENLVNNYGFFLHTVSELEKGTPIFSVKMCQKKAQKGRRIFLKFVFFWKIKNHEIIYFLDFCQNMK